MKHTGPLAWLAGIVCAFCLMIAFLITSVEAVVYWTPGYFETEYETYQVPETVHMQMDDLLYVTEEMMAYLRGNRDICTLTQWWTGRKGNFLTRGRLPIWKM